MRFRKSIKIASGVKINLSKSGLSTTIGGKGLSANIGSRGAYLNTGIPGTGVSTRHKLAGRTDGGVTKVETLDGLSVEEPEAFVPVSPALMRDFGVFFFVCAIVALLSAIAIGIPGLVIAGACIFIGVCLCRKPKDAGHV